MPKYPTDVVAGEVIDPVTYGNPVRNRTVQRMSNSADRDASYPVPEAGDICYVADIAQVQIYDGTGWVRLVDEDATDVFLRLTGGTLSGFLELGDTSDSFQRLSLNRDGRTGRLETTGNGFNFFTMLTTGDFPIRFNPNQITVLRLDDDLATFMMPVLFPAGSNLAPTVRFGGMQTDDGMYGDGDEISVAFDAFRHFTVRNSAGGVNEAHVEAKGNVAVPMNVQRDQDGLDDSAIMIRFMRNGEANIDLTWGDLQKIKALP